MAHNHLERAAQANPGQGIGEKRGVGDGLTEVPTPGIKERHVFFGVLDTIP